jgi:type IV secretion system protein VirD4
LGLFATDTLAAQQDSEGRLVAVGETSSRLTLYLDELTAVGRLDLVARGIAYLRGFGVQVVFAVQTLNQLLDVYSQYESLRGNVSYFVAFPSTEQRTAEDISRQLGKMTIRMEDEGLSSGESVFTRRRSTTQRDQERPLLMPDEVRRLGNHQPITMVTGAFPILNHLKGYYEFRELVEKTKIPVPALEPEEHESASVWRDTKALEPDLEQFRNLDDAGRPIRGPSKKETQEFREPEVDGADIDAY